MEKLWRLIFSKFGHTIHSCCQTISTFTAFILLFGFYIFYHKIFYPKHKILKDAFFSNSNAKFVPAIKHRLFFPKWWFFFQKFEFFENFRDFLKFNFFPVCSTFLTKILKETLVDLTSLNLSITYKNVPKGLIAFCKYEYIINIERETETSEQTLVFTQ